MNLREIRRRPQLPPAFFQRDVLDVARDLLGKGLLSVQAGKVMLCEIVETEAYRAADDPASHSFRGETPRTRSMFKPGGACYVYLSYGINHCMNVVTGPAGDGSAVLLRAAAPLFGAEQMALNRGLGLELTPKTLKNLLSGPGKLTRALGIDLRHDGLVFGRPADLAVLDLGISYLKRQIGTTPRIGISQAANFPWRFIVKDSEWLSRPAGR